MIENTEKVWETPDEDFFSMVEEGAENSTASAEGAEAVIADVTKDELETGKPKPEDNESGKEGNDKKKPEEEDFFSKLKEEETTETVVDKGTENAGGEDNTDANTDEPILGTHLSRLKYLQEQGFVEEHELEEGQEMTEELAETLAEDGIEEYDKRVVKGAFDKFPDFVKNLNTFVFDGGDYKEYLNQMLNSATSSITDDMDMELEANQELVAREMMLSEDNDPETVDAQIEFFKDSGKLAAFAEKKHAKWKTQKTSRADALLVSQEATKRKDREDIKQAKLDTVAYLDKNRDIGGLPVGRNIKKILPSFMQDKTVTLTNGTKISEMQKALYIDLPKNPVASAQLAILLNSRKEDGTFDFSKIAAKANTKQTREIKDKVQRGGQPVQGSKRTIKPAPELLANIFEN